MRILATTVAVLCATTVLAGSATRAAAADDYLIGLIAGTTGAYGSTGIATVNGATMAVDEINAAGGVDGHKFRLEAHNDNASATLSGQLYEKLIAQGAIVIAGSPDTGPVTAQLAMRHKFPTIGVVDDGGLTVNPDGPTSPPNPWVFDFGLNTFAWGEKIGEYALKHCPDGLAVLHDPSTYGQGGLFGIKLAYDKAGKTIAIDHTITENWSTGATAGLMPEVNAIKAAGIKCADVWLTPQDQAAFVQDMHSINYAATVFGNDETNADDTYASLAGDLAHGTISAMLTSDLHPSPELQAFRDAYKKRFNVEATPFAETSYDSIKMLAQVIKDTKSVKPADLQKGFNAVQGFKGLSGDLGFSEKNHITINAEQLTLVKYDSKSKAWVEVTD
ncbi:ABC transporter substrate-binding protein [Labrys wisconsinensis]|uniref:ABC-type branched-subunit amino acid transport system substrate-binding protein n=1 Tax=Labrys wisconsinensis TaxID=425677 RepID=A0ABU0JG12_9HYPH|nr:ABC transporter substrate-binding protein [Labrys wisconsinensis]MDQ0473223.1 ABC-type branched-subunit amino acid transport system substrate-binding protein [Labrys wisconsinensis]